jgi:hypothetical protein
VVAAVRKHAFDKGKVAAGAFVEHQRNAGAVLDVARMDGDVQQQTARVDQDVTLATRELLASIIALRVERRLPF